MDEGRAPAGVAAGSQRRIVLATTARPSRDDEPPWQAAASPPAASGALAFEPRRELVCRVCGYGASVVTVPESCPMCRSSAWEQPPWVRLARGRRDTRLATLEELAGG